MSESSFGEHMGEYGKDIWSTYVTAGVKEKDPIKMATGVVMTPLSLLLEGPDHLYAGLVGQKYEAPTGIAGRIRRDAGMLLKDVVTLHPLKALGDAWRLGTSDWILDVGDGIGRHTRDRAHYALAA